MPENPSDDAFADLFGKLPDPRTRESAAPADPPPAAAQARGGDGAPTAPLSRREARLAGQAGTPAPASAPQAPDPAAAPPRPAAPPMPASDAAARGTASAGAPAAPRTPRPDAPVAGARPPRTGEPAAAARAAAPAATQASALQDLFSGDVTTDSIGHVPPPKDKRRRRRGGWIALGIVVVLVGGIAAGGLWTWTTYEDKIRAFMGWEPPKDYEAGKAHGEALVTIASGDTGSTISASLASAGVTKTSSAFYDMLVKAGANPTFYPGVYKLQKEMTASAALAALQDPANKLANSALLREGLTEAQILKILSDSLKIPLADFQAAVKNPAAYGVQAPTLEGWLFPAMYTFDPGVTAQQVVKTLVDRTVKSLDAAGVPQADREKILTIASIIQREAREEADFYKVSRVIQNRLDQGMMLQMDSTAQYGYNEHKGTASSSQAALDDVNDWNTYKKVGLPIGPIASPGDKAIDAAMKPAAGPWLYFVTVNLDTGETVFSTTYAQHQKAVSQWQQWCQGHPDSGC
jgi:UPF0755 protein